MAEIEIIVPPDDDHPEGACEVTWLDDQRVLIHYVELPERDRTTVNGIPCTTALRTVIDIAPDLPRRSLKRVVTDCLRRELFTVAHALARTGERDMVDRAGARLLRDEVLRRR
ncbi:MAG TPA: hypothetical protein VFB78_13665 [Acidimicrobiales bacterium]|nr:hypothetical protein [Acidimicrobiales bacterium]